MPHSPCRAKSKIDGAMGKRDWPDVIVVKRGPEYEVLAVNSMDEMFLASPAVVDGELFLRGQEHLFCISDD